MCEQVILCKQELVRTRYLMCMIESCTNLYKQYIIYLMHIRYYLPLHKLFNTMTCANKITWHMLC